MDLAARARMIQGVDGVVRLTTKSGATFDAVIARTVWRPTTLVLRIPGHTVNIEDFEPDTLRIPVSKLREADRPGDPLGAPDDKKLLKAINRPIELPTKASKAGTKRAVKALSEVTADSVWDAVAAGIACNLDVSEASGLVDTLYRTSWLKKAVVAGADVSVTSLLREGDDVDELLALAAATGKLFVVRALLAADADPNAVVADAPASDLDYVYSATHTILHWALANGHLLVARALAAAGAQLAHPHGLVQAVIEASDPAQFEWLLAQGLDPNLRDAKGHPIARTLGSRMCTGMLAAVIDAGADMNARYPDGSTLLLHSVDVARFKDPSTFFVQQLLKAGAAPNVGRLYGRSALALALEVPFDPGAYRQERWLAEWLEKAGATAVVEEGAAPLPQGEPPAPPPPVWRARIDADLPRTGPYSVQDLSIAVRTILPDAARHAVQTPVPSWDGLGADQIALVRGKLQHVAGEPIGRGDDYKISFEYAFTVTVDEEPVELVIADWKAREIGVSASTTGAAAERAVQALWELLTVAPLAVYSDRFRFDEHARCRYRSDGRTAFADFPK